MKLILMTPPSYFVEEDKIITALFEEGLDILHLRKPNTAPMYAERLLTLIPEQYHKRIVVHGHFYLKEEYKLKGIHLSERNPNAPEDYKGHLSRSCHTLEELKANKKGHDYLFFNPVFDEISKPSYMGNYTPEEIRKAHKAGSKFRLWAFPDNEDAWEMTRKLGMDFINTDHPDRVAKTL